MKPMRNLDVSERVGVEVGTWMDREGGRPGESAVVGDVGPLPERKGSPDECLRETVVEEKWLR